MSREIEGWKEFQDYINEKIDSLDDRKRLSIIVYALMCKARYAGKENKILCQCEIGRYCNVECNL